MCTKTNEYLWDQRILGADERYVGVTNKKETDEIKKAINDIIELRKATNRRVPLSSKKSIK